MSDATHKTRPKMPVPVIRPSGTYKKPLPPGVDPQQALRMSQTSVFHPKNKDEQGGGAPTEAAQGESGDAMIQLPAAPVLQSLPETLVDPEKLAAAQVPEHFAFEAGVLLPQLTSGKIMMFAGLNWMSKRPITPSIQSNPTPSGISASITQDILRKWTKTKITMAPRA